MAEHPITPPPELVLQWASESLAARHLCTQAVRWGADQELEACCSEVSWNGNKALAAELRRRRRPKPPSLKEQALEALDRMDQLPTAEDQRIIRRALEALPE